MALAAVTCVAYANSLHAGFVLDNRALILQDPRVHQLSSENLGLILNHSYWWPRAEHGLYRPLTTVSLLFNYAVLGNADRPLGYHIVNLTLHVINVWLVYALGLRLVRRFWPAVFIAAVWAVHPVLTESVTNIIGRSDLLAATGILGGLWLYLDSAGATGLRRLACLVGLMAVTFIGVFSKESAIAIVGVLALYALVWRTTRGVLLASLAIAPPLLLMLYARALVLAHAPAPEFHFVDNPLIGAPFLVARLTAIRVMGDYLWTLVWPATLSSDYSYAQIPLAHGSLHDWIGVIVVLTLAAAAAWQLRRHRMYAFFAGFAFVTFVPMSNLLFLTGTIMAERFLYLPSIGVVACVVLALYAAADRWSVRWCAPVALGVLIVVLGVRTWHRNADWQDDVSLWTSAVQAAPMSYETHRGVAVTLFESDPSHANIAAVLAEAERALAILDPLPDRLNTTAMYADAGNFYRQQGDLLSRYGAPGASVATPEAARAYARSLEILLRGVAIDAAVNQDYAQQEIARGRAASEIAPVGLPLLYEHLADTRARLGDHEHAIVAARYARSLAPATPDAPYVLARTLAEAGRLNDSAVALVGYFLISGQILDPLPALYRSGLDTKGCAIAQLATGATLNPSCELVHEELCTASADLAEIYRWNRRPDLAEQARSRAASAWGCAALGR